MDKPRTLNHHHEHISGPFKILTKERLTPTTNRFLIDAPFVARAAEPGQFVIVRVIERRRAYSDNDSRIRYRRGYHYRRRTGGWPDL